VTRDRLSALVFLALSLGYGALAFDIRLFPGSEEQLFTARTMPLGLAVLGAVVSLLILATAPSVDRENRPPPARRRWGRVLGLCVLMLAYGATVTRVGFVVSTALFLTGGMVLLGERRWFVIGALAVGTAVAFWFILSRLLGVYLEPGLLI
jgi:putative tricarboxylic transport membrane protein